MTWIKKKPTTDGDDRGLSAKAFAALLFGAFAVVAGCALVGGWAGLIGIAVTAVLLTTFGATRL
ncbi:hypothetical protein [Streptomyces sp. NPDC005408]|uniref:hypothetical protein n=1 Tax=Streptomyces sp. NPDC005408 TaxID=3155341 RepID=UPI0033B399E2